MAPRRGREYWYPLVEEYEASGQSQTAFAKRRAVSVGTLRHWITRYRSERAGLDREAAGSAVARLVEVSVRASSGAGTGVRLVLGSMVWLELSGLPPVEYLVELADALERERW